LKKGIGHTEFKDPRFGNSPYQLKKIPQQWNYIKLGNENSGELINGLNKKKEDYGHGCLHVNIDNLFEKLFIDLNQLGRVNATKKEIKNYQLLEGDICLLRSSVKWEGVGYPALFPGSDDPVVFSGFIIRFRPKEDFWDPIFLTYLLQLDIIRLNVMAWATKSANININQNSLSNLPLPHPEIKEQRKIASILSKVDNLIDSYDTAIELSKKQKKGLMQQLLTKGIGHKKFKKLFVIPRFIDFSIPESWKNCSISELSSEIKDGPMGFALHTYDYKDKGIPILRIQNLKNLTVTKDDLRFITKEKHEELKKSQVKPLDIIISKTGILGVIGVVPSNYGPANLNQALARITLKDKQFVRYVSMFLSSKIPQQILRVVGSGRTVQAGLKMSDIKNLEIPLLPLEEQKQITTILSNADSKISELESKKTNLERLKKGLMQKLLTGQIRVSVGI